MPLILAAHYFIFSCACKIAMLSYMGIYLHWLEVNTSKRPLGYVDIQGWNSAQLSRSPVLPSPQLSTETHTRAEGSPWGCAPGKGARLLFISMFYRANMKWFLQETDKTLWIWKCNLALAGTNILNGTGKRRLAGTWSLWGKLRSFTHSPLAERVRSLPWLAHCKKTWVFTGHSLGNIAVSPSLWALQCLSLSVRRNDGFIYKTWRKKELFSLHFYPFPATRKNDVQP